MLTGVIALLLALGGAPLAAAAAAPGVSGPPQPDVGSGSGISVTMTTQNDGHTVSLLDQAHPGWAHPELGALQDVLVTVQLNGTPVHQWDSHLETPDAFQGITPPDCRGDEEAPPQQISCLYRVQVAEGLNALAFRFSADGGRVTTYAVGFLTGGALGWTAGWEVLDATGQWRAVAHDQTIELPATLSSALRYVVTNDGGIPFRIDSACSTRLLAPREQLRCPVRGVRPAQSLAGDYAERLHLHDVVGRNGQIDIGTTVRAFAGVFTLEKRSVTVGQPVVVRASGLPRGSSFAMQFRLDDEPVLVGTKVTKTGASRLEFPLPSTSQGTAHLQVEHDGIAIASLPFDVTLVPRAPDAAAPVWPWLLLLLVPLAGLIVLLRIRSLRRRAASREPPGPHPYPDASRATQEPAAARRR